jgi:hypothetical protein
MIQIAVNSHGRCSENSRADVRGVGAKLLSLSDCGVPLLRLICFFVWDRSVEKNVRRSKMKFVRPVGGCWICKPNDFVRRFRRDLVFSPSLLVSPRRGCAIDRRELPHPQRGSTVGLHPNARMEGASECQKSPLVLWFASSSVSSHSSMHKRSSVSFAACSRALVLVSPFSIRCPWFAFGTYTPGNSTSYKKQSHMEVRGSTGPTKFVGWSQILVFTSPTVALLTICKNRWPG